MNDLSDPDTLNNVLRELFFANKLEAARDVVHKGLRHQQLMEMMDKP